MEILKTTAQGNYISFASGLPDPSLFPAERIATLTQEVLASESSTALQYGAAEGYAPLRAFVAERLRQRGIAFATPEHILITNGSQQALDLSARLRLDTGSPVALETPTYLAALQTFDSYEAQYYPLSMDSEGLCVSEAKRVIREVPLRLLFTLPNFQNPAGITQSLARRQELAEALAEKQTPLLEDDAYYDLRYSGEALPPIAALAENREAIYTGTFSKVIAPGLRVGYLCAEPTLVQRLTQLKQITDLHTGSLTQRVVYRFCERGWLEEQIAFQNRVYAERQQALLGALAMHFTGRAEWTRPEGGMFVLVTLPQHIDTTERLAHAMERGIVYIPATTFYPTGEGKNVLRLNFVSSTPEAIAKGVATLSEVLFASPLP
jgi:2-aminoadipate transaminase